MPERSTVRKCAGVAVPLLLAMAAYMVSLSRFYFADLLLILAGAIGCLGWWNLGWFCKNVTGPKGKIHTVYDRPRQIVGCSVIVLASWILCHFTNAYALNKELEEHIDWLIPAADTRPSTACPANAAGTLEVILGSSAAYAMTFPATLISIDDKEQLTLNKDDKGRIAISGDIYDEEDNIVVSITNNRFDVSPNIFKMDRPDQSTLSVFITKHNEEVLRIRFMNPYTLRIEGHFWESHGHNLEIRDDRIMADGSTGFRGNCVEIGGRMGLFIFKSGVWGMGFIKPR